MTLPTYAAAFRTPLLVGAIALGVALIAAIIWVNRDMSSRGETWREWTQEFPTVSAIVITALAFLMATGVFTAAIAIGGVVNGVDPSPQYVLALDSWLENVLWLVGIAVGGVAAKRATTKPEVIRAETERIASIVAPTTAPTDAMGEQGEDDK